MANEPMARQNEIIIYQPDDTLRLDVALSNDTVWLNQQQMSELFGRERSVIAKHIRNAFSEGELIQKSVCANFAQTAADGKTYQVDFYNLDDFSSSITQPGILARLQRMPEPASLR